MSSAPRKRKTRSTSPSSVFNSSAMKKAPIGAIPATGCDNQSRSADAHNSTLPTLVPRSPAPPHPSTKSGDAFCARSVRGGAVTRSTSNHRQAFNPGSTAGAIPTSTLQPHRINGPQESIPLYLTLPQSTDAERVPNAPYTRGEARCIPSQKNVSGKKSLPTRTGSAAYRPGRNEPTQLILKDSSSYVVGNAIINPNLSLSPSVQEGMREVPSLVPLPETALRGIAGSNITQLSNESRRGAPSCSAVVRRETTNTATTLEAEAIVCGSSDSVVPTHESVKPLFMIEELTMKKLRDSKNAAPSGMQSLREKYGTTTDSVRPHNSVAGNTLTTAKDILPQLLHAEEKAAELAEARRHIDWDTRIPAEDSVQPPVIAFLSEEGVPVPHIKCVTFSLDAASLTLQRCDEGTRLNDLQPPLSAVLSTRSRSPGRPTGSSTRKEPVEVRAPAMTAQQLADAVQTIGRRVVLNDGVHRVKGLVGLVKGLPELVGLERVKEYEITSEMCDMFLAMPYIDSEVGDLVLHINPSLQGTIRLEITGVDCASIDTNSGKVVRSANTLYCLVKIYHAGDQTHRTSMATDQHPSPRRKGDDHSQGVHRMAPTIGNHSCGLVHTTDHTKGYIFPATNPHDLFYTECLFTAREALSEHQVALKKRSPLPDKPLSRYSPGSDGNPSITWLYTMNREETANDAYTSLLRNKYPASEDAGKSTELRESMYASPWWAMGSLLSPMDHFCYTAWQDRVTGLAQNDEDFFDAEVCRAIKSQAVHELGDIISGLDRSFAHNTSGTGRRNSTAQLQNQPNSERIIPMLRRLIVCLLSEERRASRKQFHDITHLCNHLCNTALLKTTATTGGTWEGLHQMALSVVPQGSNPAQRHSSLRRSTLQMSVKEKEHLATLLDALEVAMLSMFVIGSYKECALYATQRVNAMYVRERDNTVAVCAAKRDLAEMCYFYGDYPTAAKVADDVMLLTEKLYDIDSLELLEAQNFVCLTSLANGERDRAGAYFEKLRSQLNESSSYVPDIIRAKFRLSYAYAYLLLPTHAELNWGMKAEHALELVREAVCFLSGSGDLSEMEKSTSMSLFSNAQITPSEQPHQHSARSESVCTRPSTTRITHPNVEGSQKRLRWILLAMASSLLIRFGELQVGITTLEKVLEGIVLSSRHHWEKLHRADLASILWVELAIWKLWMWPSDMDETRTWLKQVVRSLTRVKGPLHPVVATAALAHAYVLLCIPHSGALKIATYNIDVLSKSLWQHSRSMIFAHIVCVRINNVVLRWRCALEHSNAALITAQHQNESDEVMCSCELEFLGCVLRCPATTQIKMNVNLFLQRMQERLVRMEMHYGSESDAIIPTLSNLAEAYYLLQRFSDAISCLQRAVRLTDPKGALFVTAALLKPSEQLPTAEDTLRRNAMVQGVLQTPAYVLNLAHLLFSLAAVLEAVGSATEALDCYSRCLALHECAGVENSLSYIRVCTAITKLLYTEGEVGDAFGWAHKVQRAVRLRYKEWPQEVASARMLVSIVEKRIEDLEGTYVTINTLTTLSSKVEII